MSSESLINRYRPTKFSQVVGQDEVVKSFRIALEDKISHAFLFTGPSGIGKTTLSRLGAKFVGCVNKPNLIEVDAATYNGVDDFRGLTENLRSRPLGGVSKALIIDECFAPSTLIETLYGECVISSIKVGDVIIGARGASVVKQVFKNKISVS